MRILPHFRVTGKSPADQSVQGSAAAAYRVTGWPATNTTGFSKGRGRGQVVQHAGAGHVVELPPEPGGVLQRQLRPFEVVDAVARA